MAYHPVFQLLQNLIELSSTGSEERVLLESTGNHVAARCVDRPHQPTFFIGISLGKEPMPSKRSSQLASALHESPQYDPGDLNQSLDRYFVSLATELDQARQAIRLHDLSHADRFNVFDYIRPDENVLSDIVADLLDPKGTHGQEDTFLRWLFKIVHLPFPCDREPVVVYREELTRYISNPLRRIDILLDFGSFGVGIENKPWAQEQVDQVKDYLDNLSRRYGDQFLLLYFSGDGSAPTSVPVARLVRLEVSNQFRVLAYPLDVTNWLDGCREHCRAEKVRWFLSDLSRYVQGHFRLSFADWRRAT